MSEPNETMSKAEIETELKRLDLDPQLEAALQKLYLATVEALREKQARGEPPALWGVEFKDDE